MVKAAFRSTICCLAIAAILLSGCGKKPEEAPVPATQTPPKSPEPLPIRAAGLWETTVRESGSEEVQTLQICLDAATDRRLGVMGTNLSGNNCGPRTVSRLGPDSWGLLAACTLPGGGSEEYSGSVTGDYAKAYAMKLRVQTTGAPLPQMNRVANYIIESKRLGACTEGQKPGDVISEGVTVNLFEVAEAN